MTRLPFELEIMVNLRSVVRALPPVARRDAAIAQLKSERAQLRDKLNAARTTTANSRAEAARAEAAATVAAQTASELRMRLAEAEADRPAPPSTPVASWAYKVVEAVRLRSAIVRTGVDDPIWDVNDKASGYRFAASHGIDAPQRIADYENFDDIDWAALPESFVIKTVNGATSHGVVPIQRHEERVVDLLNVRQGPVDVSDVMDYLRRMNAAGKCSRDVVIEELLRSPFDARGLAPDLKLYCFYGEIAMIMIRDVGGSRLSKHFAVKFIDAEGTDLGQAILGRAVDPTLPEPLHLEDVVRVGETLSAAMPTPFIRVDLFERPDKVVFGEITPGPGGIRPLANQTLRDDLDLRFGAMWERAEARLRAETIASKALDVRYGDYG